MHQRSASSNIDKHDDKTEEESDERVDDKVTDKADEVMIAEADDDKIDNEGVMKLN